MVLFLTTGVTFFFMSCRNLRTYICLHLFFFGYRKQFFQHSFWDCQNWSLQVHLCRLFDSIPCHSFLPTHIGGIVYWWVRNYNDVNGVELACNGIANQNMGQTFLEGGGETLRRSTITVSDTKQYACHWKENISFFKTVYNIFT